MERAPLSTAASVTERALLLAARERNHWSQQEVAQQVGVSKAAVHRWEKKGDVPQPYHLRKLCHLFGATARELGFEENSAGDGQATMAEPEGAEAQELTAFRGDHLLSRLMRIVWNWSRTATHYHMLQLLIRVELEESTMTLDDISRRDALRFLALIPVDLLGLSPVHAVFQKDVTHEDILKYCATGIVACWGLRKGKELAFADQAASTYIPTLKAMAQRAPEIQRKSAADLLAQCFLLKAALAWAVTTPQQAIAYAQQAEAYGTIADSGVLQVTALRARAAALSYAEQWKHALQAAEKAKYLLEQRDKQDRKKEASVFSRTAYEPLPQLIHSYVYAGLATYQAYAGRREDALRSLQKASVSFFAQSPDEKAPVWVDHHIGNLLLNDGETHTYLGIYKSALASLKQIDEQFAQDTTIPLTNRVNALTNQIMAEVQRDDQPRDMQWCVQQWMHAMTGAKMLKSNLRFQAAIQAYTAMRAAWPAEKQVKDLREQIVHW